MFVNLMSMSFDKIKKEILSNQFKPIYFFGGAETYFIDQLTDLIEANALTEAQKDFNLHVFYAKDSDPQDVLNAARRYPVFADRQLVIVKEAQHFAKKWEEFLSYAENPVESTILVFSHKHKSLDKRTTFGKLIAKEAVHFDSKKIKDYQVTGWIKEFLGNQGMSIEDKSAYLVAEHIGNDLAKITNELDKLLINIPKGEVITPNHIEKHIGISKDFNAFELSNAIADKNYAKAMNIIHYYEQNPKAGPFVLVLASIYNFFSKLFQLHHSKGMSDREIMSAIKVPPFVFKNYKAGAGKYPLSKTEEVVMEIATYDARSKGIGNTGRIGHYELLKELVYKIMQ